MERENSVSKCDAKKRRKKVLEVRKYNKDDEGQKEIDRHVTIYVTGTNMVNTIVENPLFRSMLEVLDPRYCIPGRAHLSAEIDSVVDVVIERIRSSLSNARIHFCTDIWTKKGLSL